MTPNEMKFLFELKFEKKSQNRAIGFNTYELETLFNEAQDTLLDEIVNGKSPNLSRSNRNKQSADLRNIRKSIKLPVYNSDINNRLITVLPHDFAYLDGISFEIDTRTGLNCTTTLLKTSNYIKEYIGFIDLANLDLNTVFTNDPTTNPPKLEINKISGVVDLLDVDYYDFDFSSNSNNVRLNEYIDYILEVVNLSDDYELYWENYNNNYYRNQFILVAKNYQGATEDSSYEPPVDATKTTTSNSGTTDSNFNGLTIINKLDGDSQGLNSTFSQNTYQYDIISPLLEPNINLVHGKTTDSDRIERFVNHPFKGTKYNSVLYDLRDGQLISFKNDNFNILSTRLNYIKRLRRINFFNNISCELPEELHREVVDIAVARLLQSVGSDRYSSKITDIQLNNNN